MEEEAEEDSVDLDTVKVNNETKVEDGANHQEEANLEIMETRRSLSKTATTAEKIMRQETAQHLGTHARSAKTRTIGNPSVGKHPITQKANQKKEAEVPQLDEVPTQARK